MSTTSSSSPANDRRNWKLQALLVGERTMNILEANQRAPLKSCGDLSTFLDKGANERPLLASCRDFLQMTKQSAVYRRLQLGKRPSTNRGKPKAPTQVQRDLPTFKKENTSSISRAGLDCVSSTPTCGLSNNSTHPRLEQKKANQRPNYSSPMNPFQRNQAKASGGNIGSFVRPRKMCFCWLETSTLRHRKFDATL